MISGPSLAESLFPAVSEIAASEERADFLGKECAGEEAGALASGSAADLVCAKETVPRVSSVRGSFMSGEDVNAGTRMVEV